MLFELTDEEKMIQETAAKFAKRELEPVAAKLDKTKDRGILLGNLKKLAELGFMGLNVSPEYGGAGTNTVAFSLAMTELGRACASTTVTASVNNMVCEVIQAIGTEELKRKYIPKVCSGEYPAAGF
ncbi:MAG TPA: acyl-CoA dehydrogenase family protein, partial [Syntrophobacteria bacterium]|nr:acyl-CoA dehydrogenase family protein [Syntrophobacteria bacterium]